MVMAVQCGHILEPEVEPDKEHHYLFYALLRALPINLFVKRWRGG